jgi:hypothetical protein
MSAENGGVPAALVRDVLRDVLAELLPGAVAQAVAEREPAPEAGAAVPLVPPPPVAAVHRPRGYRAADTAAPPTASGGGGMAEHVSLTSDAELEAFVLRLLRLFESPRDRAAIRSGRVRFRLGPPHGPTGAPGSAVMRVERGAVTERMVDEAATAGARLVLGRRAVATPLARDRARRLGVEIEKEA